MLNEIEKKKIVAKLTEKRVNVKCPMCGNDKFTVIDGYIRNDLQSDFNNLNLGGPAIPSVAIACLNCGYISQHSVGILGLLSVKEGEK
jgi:uncharacterized Zn finger protein